MKKSIKKIPFFVPSVGEEEAEAVSNVIKNKWLTTGDVTADFEKKFASFTGAKNAIAVNSATAGLHLSLAALKIPRNSIVITTPYTHSSTAEVIRYMDAVPFFADIENDSFNIDPCCIEKILKERKSEVSAVIPVHIGGYMCDMERIGEICSPLNIAVIEDASHALPAWNSSGRHAGTFGKTGVFSFYATKTMTTGEGGMIITDDDSVASSIKMMRLHGISRDAWERKTGKGNSWSYDVKLPGFKYNLTDMAGAMGLVQLKKVKLFAEKRKKIAEAFNKNFRGYDFIKLPPSSPGHSWHLYIIELVPEKLKISRDGFIDRLEEKGISVSVHFIPLHLTEYYKTKYGFKPDDFPVAYRRYMNSISLPIYPDLADDDVEYIIKTIISIGTEYRKNQYAG